MPVAKLPTSNFNVLRNSRFRLQLERPTIAVALAIYGTFIVLTWWFNDLPLFATAPLGALILAWHSSFQHETIHGHPTNSRKINTILGWAPLSLWLPYEVYRETHLRHHRCKGNRLTRPADDPESHYLPGGALTGAGRMRRAVVWLNGTLIGRLTVGPALSVLRFWKHEAERVMADETGRLAIWFRHGVSTAILLVWIVLVCRISVPIYMLAIVYPSISLGHLRSFAEHRHHVDPHLRTNVVETNRLFSLIFLNNNLHIAHHAKPSAPWYSLPAAWNETRHSAIAAGTLVKSGYRSLFADHFLRPVIAAEYPAAE